MTLASLRNTEPIPGYQITERLGAGGYGEVWKAEAPGGLQKAIKFIYGFMTDEKASRELKALNRIKQIRHPFLLSLERIEVVDGQLIIVTELADISLKDRFQVCKQTGLPAIPRPEMIDYLRDAADALDFLSANALQHLDVKPENLLLVGGRIKVADFGLVKDIHDRTCSMMGGMTPVYASPEVFDGRPCAFSDQYSLAILYQEMITGTLPFPGNTAAQLASQHLHSRPRLESLPEDDREPIARALAKNPLERFPTCRAMVEALLAGRNRAASSAPATPAASPPGTSGDTTSAAAQVTKSVTPTPAEQASANAIRRTPSPRLRPSPFGASAVVKERPSTPLVVPQAAAITDLPPLDAVGSDAGLRPTLVLGLGGIGTQVVAQLRRRFVDRFGDLSRVPTLQTLAVDTSSASLIGAASIEKDIVGDRIDMPLRRPQDYRAESGDILQWLSRRWLYNIPRSLKTEGLRPLGRLAFVDHAGKLFAALHEKLLLCASEESMATAEQSAGVPLRSRDPRVFIVASVSGGTGSGMLLDTAFAVRAILRDMGLSDNGVCGILVHLTGRMADGKELAIANAYSCLEELEHYSDKRYPGESTCGLPEAEPGERPFDETYFVDLGKQLTDRDFTQAIDSLAEYLYLDSATPVGTLLDQCRETNAAPAGGTKSPLRSFGVCQMGCKKNLSAGAVEALCRSLLESWTGETPGGKQPGSGKAKSDHDPVTKLASLHALDAASLVDQFQQKLHSALLPDRDTALQRIVAKLVAEAGRSSDEGDRWPALTRRAEELLGLGEDADETKDTAQVQLGKLANTVHGEYLDKCAMALGQAIFELASRSEFRLSGAHEAAQRLADRLRGVEKELSTAIRELQNHFVAGTDDQSVPNLAPRGKKPRREDRSEQAILQERLSLHCRYLVERLALTGAARVARTLAGRLAIVCETLVTLRRDAAHIMQQFTVADGWSGDRLQAGDPASKDADDAVLRELQRRIGNLASQFERRVDAELVAPSGGLLQILTDSEALAALPAKLRVLARREVADALKEIDVAKLALGPLTDAATRGGLDRFMQTAWPKALDTGGAKRLLLVMPESVTAERLPLIIEQTRHEKPTVINGSGGEVIACYEAEQLDLGRVAASIVADDPNYITVARRLHTRTDVEWTPL